MRLSSEPLEIFCFIGIGMLIGSILHFTATMDANKASSAESAYDSSFRSFEYHNHKYLKYTDPVINAFSTTLHDPDCPCWTNRLEVVK